MPENNFFENKAICSRCKGRCCEQMPGACFPEDFDMEHTTENLITAILDGNYAIDSWEGDPGDGINKTAYFVRPATKSALGEVYDNSWGGECVFLTGIGCELEAKNRPSECQSLEPKEKLGCELHNNKNKQNSALQWRKYFNILNSFQQE